MTNVSDNQQERPLIGGKDYVSCAICGHKAKLLIMHLLAEHNLKTSEYRKLYPGWRIECELSTLKRTGNSVKATMLKYGVTTPMKVPSIAKKQSASRQKTCLEKYGVDSILKSTTFQDSIQPLAKQGVLNKYGVTNVMLSDTVKENLKASLQKKYGVDNAMKVIEFARKNRSKNGSKPSEPETIVKTLLPKYVKYTGNGKFWVRFSDGSLKNPDFVVRPFRKWKKVVEVFGVYWHKKEEEVTRTEEYNKVGVRCLIIWEDELCDLEKVRNRINAFLKVSSETICQTS